MKRIFSTYFSIDTYLKWNKLEKKISKYRHLDFNVILSILNRNNDHDVTFIQIGASDGVTNDPIHPFIKKYGWKGSLIEPLPDVFNQLKQNYDGCRQLQLLNVAISDQQGSLLLYRVPPSLVTEEWHKQLASFDRSSIEFNLRTRPDLINAIESIEVPTISLNTLFKDPLHNFTDLLVIDVEGYEYNILKQLRYITNKPTYIFFERGTMSADNLIKLYAFLKEEDYTIYHCGPDDLAVLKKSKYVSR